MIEAIPRHQILADLVKCIDTKLDQLRDNLRQVGAHQPWIINQQSLWRQRWIWAAGMLRRVAPVQSWEKWSVSTDVFGVLVGRIPSREAEFKLYRNGDVLKTQQVDTSCIFTTSQKLLWLTKIPHRKRRHHQKVGEWTSEHRTLRSCLEMFEMLMRAKESRGDPKRFDQKMLAHLMQQSMYFTSAIPETPRCAPGLRQEIHQKYHEGWCPSGSCL